MNSRFGMKSVPRCLAIRNHILCVCVLEIVCCLTLMCSFHLCGRELDGEVSVQVVKKVVPEELVLFSVCRRILRG